MGKYCIVAMLLFVPVLANAAANLEMLSPRGGEVYVIAQNQQIQLSSKLKQVTVEISRDGGVSFVQLGTIDNTVKNKALRNVLNFSIGGPSSSNCVIRARGMTTKGEVSVSSRSFSIVASLDIAAQAGALPSGVVTTGALANSAVTTLTLADGSVTTPKLADRAATVAKIGSEAASSGMVLYADGSGGAQFGSLPAAPTGSNIVAAINDAATTGTIDIARLPSTLASKTYVDAANATQDNALAGKWSLSGNAGTTAGTHFIGTTDSQPLEFKVFGDRVLRIEPGSQFDGPNIIGGFSGNTVAAGLVCCTIAGGGNAGFENKITGSFGTVGGGEKNEAYAGSTIGGGQSNTASGIAANIGGGILNVVSGNLSVIAGGENNEISGVGSAIAGGGRNKSDGSVSFIGGGDGNLILESFSVIGGGYLNSAKNTFVTIAGGESNTSIGAWASIGGGDRNAADGQYSTAGGGSQNVAGGEGATVAGGVSNTATGGYSVIVGGLSNIADADYSVVSGRRAKNDNPLHSGVFLFADGNDLDFKSAGANEFAARVTGGVRLVTAIDGAGAATKTFSIDAAGNVGVQGTVKIGAATIRSGMGTPEGSVTGSIGDLFLRTDGGAGSTLYIKESGSATNTGWVAK